MSSTSSSSGRAEPMEAPVFYPTPLEWNESPLSYMERVVRPYGEITGIVKIVPPTGWRPPYCVDYGKFTFPTRQQHVNRLECRSRLRILFELALRKFKFSTHQPMDKQPKTMQSSTCPNWYLLFTLAARHGVDPSRTSDEEDDDDGGVWSAVQQELQQIRTNEFLLKQEEVEVDSLFGMSPSELKHEYVAKLRDFHLHLCQLEQEDGEGRKVASSDVSPAHKHHPMDIRESASKGLDGVIWGARAQEAGYRASVLGQRAAQLASSSASSAAPIPSLGPPHALELTMEMFSTLPPKPKPGDTFWKFFAQDNQCWPGQVVQCVDRKQDTWKVLYRQQNASSSSSSPFETEEQGSDLALAICCGASADEAQYAVQVGVCQICNRAHLPSSLLMCDECEYRFHDLCLLLPTTTTSPTTDKDWFCPLCLNQVKQGAAEDAGSTDEEGEEEEDEDAHLEALRKQHNAHRPLSLVARAIGVKELAEFGFPDGDSFVLDEYIANDKEFRQQYQNNSSDGVFATEETIEREFWRIVGGAGAGTKQPQQVHVQYGNDIDTAALGSGFPTKSRADRWAQLKRLTQQQRQEYDAYAKSPWNLNNLPTSEGSLLQLVDGNISGVIVPWLYMGMTFSAFCFHVEDHNFASINFHHRGAPKSWWGCSASAADQFELAAREMAGELVEARPDLLQGIVTMFNPWDLASRGVPMYHIVQRPGEFVVTFPRAYHGGFNHGWNSAEAVNFAGRGWLGFGDQAVARYAGLHKMPVVAHESLMVAIAAWCLANSSPESFKTAHKLLRPLLSMIKHEEHRRRTVEVAYKHRFGHEEGEDVWQQQQPQQSQEPQSKRAQMAAGGEEEPRASSSMMSRMQMLAKAFKGVPQCRTCKRYCALSHGVQAGEVLCLDHVDATALGVQLVSTIPPAALWDLVDKLCVRKCGELEHWVERATRLCRGVRQPDAALGEDCAGGPPLVFSLANVRAFRVSPEIDTTCTRVKDWKARPTMEACRKLLALPAVAFLVEESHVLARAVEVSEQFCQRWRVLLLLPPQPTPEADKVAVVDLAELEKAFAAQHALPVCLPDDVVQAITAARQRAVDWQLRARAVLDKKKKRKNGGGDGDGCAALRALAQDDAIKPGGFVISMPETKQLEARLALLEWNARAEEFVRSGEPRAQAEAEALLNEHPEEEEAHNDVDLVLLQQLKLALRCAEDEARRVRYFLYGVDMGGGGASTSLASFGMLMELEHTIDEYVGFCEAQQEQQHQQSAGGEGLEFWLRSRELDKMVQGVADRKRWREAVSAVLLSPGASLAQMDALEREGRVKLNVSARDGTMAALQTTRQSMASAEARLDHHFEGGGGWREFLQQQQRTTATTSSSSAAAAAAAADECAVCASSFSCLAADLKPCTLCGKQFHGSTCAAPPGSVSSSSAAAAGQVEEGACLRCFADQLRFCYCRTSTEDQFMTQCESCFGWFHSHCAGFASDFAMEQLATFHCLACSRKRGSKYAGRVTTAGNIDLCARAGCGTLCIQGCNGEDGAGEPVRCAGCQATFHRVCLGLGLSSSSQHCIECCEASDVPVVPLRGAGFAARFAELDVRLAVSRGQRPLFSDVCETVASIQREFPGLLAFREGDDSVDAVLLQPVRAWVDKVREDRYQVGDCALWRLVDEYFETALQPPAADGNNSAGGGSAAGLTELVEELRRRQRARAAVVRGGG